MSASTRPRTLLALAAVAVAFAAADTYVVVLALPEMMAAVGVPIDQLQKAAPIVSGFWSWSMGTPTAAIISGSASTTT